jgi:hypothetical protein
MRVEPYRAEHDATMRRKMHRAGQEPRGLSAFVRWFRAELTAEAPPLRLHGRDLGDDGAPAHHPAFVAWLSAHPMETDDESYFRRPLRAAIYLVGKRSAIRGRLLERLAANGGDWAALDVCDCDCAFSTDAELYWREALRILWHEFSELRIDRPKRRDEEAA